MKYTKKILLDQLKQSAKIYGEPPTLHWWNKNRKEHNWFSAKPFVSTFGSWSQALKEAFPDFNRSPGPKPNLIDCKCSYCNNDIQNVKSFLIIIL